MKHDHEHDHAGPDSAPASATRPSPRGDKKHDHHPDVTPQGRAFFVGVTLNSVFVLVEAGYGLASGSMALLADAAHNLSDVLGLLLAWGAVVLAKRKPSPRRTYGLRRTTILAALTNAVLLLVAIGGVAWEAIGRLRAPAPVEGRTVIIVAAIGVVINALSAAMFMKSSAHDANMRGAFLHLAADAGVSLGVVITGLVLVKTGWLWLDPAMSLGVSLVILFGTWSLLKVALNLVLDSVPDHIDPEAVESYLSGLTGVCEVHDLHIWPMSTTDVALTAHVVMTTDKHDAGFLREVGKQMQERFGIGHTTLQVEPLDTGARCQLAPDEVVLPADAGSDRERTSCQARHCGPLAPSSRAGCYHPLEPVHEPSPPACRAERAHAVRGRMGDAALCPGRHQARRHRRSLQPGQACPNGGSFSTQPMGCFISA